MLRCLSVERSTVRIRDFLVAIAVVAVAALIFSREPAAQVPEVKQRPKAAPRRAKRPVTPTQEPSPRALPERALLADTSAIRVDGVFVGMDESAAIAALGEETLGETESGLLRSYGRPAGSVEVSTSPQGGVWQIQRGSTLTIEGQPPLKFGDSWEQAQSQLGQPNLSDEYGHHFYPYPEIKVRLSVETHENRVVAFSLYRQSANPRGNRSKRGP